MKKSNLSNKTHLLHIGVILCFLFSYLWIAPSQVHALPAGFQEYSVLGNEEQTYVTGEAMADNQMVYYDQWRDGYEAGLLNPVQLATEIYGDSASNEQTQPQTFALSLEDYLWSTEPLQTDKLSLSISKGDVPQTPGESNPSAPVLDSSTTLTVSIISSPWATVDNNLQPLGDAGLPGVFVVEAVVTNTNSTTATGVVVTLDYNEDPSNGWILLAGEDPVRALDELAPGAAYHAYWLARYPNDAKPQDIPVPSHQYTVTAYAANANPVATAENFYDPDPNQTVQIRSTQNTGNSGLIQTSAETVVGIAFTVTVEYDLGTGPDDAIFSPVGNDDFDPSAYRLLASQVRFCDAGETQESIVTDRLYFPTVPKLPDNSSPDKAEATFTFIAVLPSNTTLCPYAAFDFSPNPKYDEYYCSAQNGGLIPITGTLTLSQTKQASSPTIEQGQLLTYTISYTNNGGEDIPAVWIWDDVDTNIGSIMTTSINPPSDPDETTDSRVAWYLGDVGSSGQVTSTGTLTFTILIDGNNQYLADNPLLVNHAFLGINPGRLPQNAALTSTVATTIQVPVLTVTKSDFPDPVLTGHLISYTLHYTNSGSAPATNVLITDVVPLSTTYQTCSGGSSCGMSDGVVSWTIGTVPSSISATVGFSVLVSQTLAPGTLIRNEDYGIIADQTDFISGPPVTTLFSTEAAFIDVVKEANVDTAEVGETITYTYRVTNMGNVTLDPVTLSDDRLGLITLGGTSLAPEVTTSGTATYAVQESDLPGPLINTATVTGTPLLIGGVVTDTDSESVALSEAGSIYLPIILKNY